MPILVPATDIISLDDVRDQLNKTLTVDDGEIQRMINAALAEYAEYVGPLPGSETHVCDGGQISVVLPSQYATAVTAASYSDGTTIDTDDLTLDTRTGIVYWGYGTAGYFTCGRRNVSITYTVGDLPANHREVIIADVAGYFEASQRSNSSGAGAFPGEDFDEAPFRSMPMTLFPRIRALAPPRVA